VERIRRRETTPRLSFRGILISALLVFVAGCAPAGTSGETGPWIRPPDGLVGAPGENAATRAYMKKIHFNNAINSSTDAHFYTGTGANRKQVELRIDPENRAHEIDWFLAAKDKYRGGSIVARIRNKDEVAVPELGLVHKNDSAYIWVGPLKNDYSVAGVAFFTLGPDGDAYQAPFPPIHKVLRCKDSPGLFRPAAKVKQNHDDNQCQETDLGSPGSTSRSALYLTSYTPVLERALAVGGLWISCSGGCCDVGAGAFF